MLVLVSMVSCFWVLGQAPGNDPFSLVEAGLSLFKAGEYREAIVKFDEAIAWDRQFAPAYFHKANSLAALGEYRQAIVQYGNAHYLDPLMPQYLLGKAEAELLIGEPDTALYTAVSALYIRNCPPEAFDLIDRCIAQNNIQDQTLSIYYQIGASIPRYLAAFTLCWEKIGDMEFRQGQYAKAEEAYSQVVQMNSAHYGALEKQIQACYAQAAYDRGNALKMLLWGSYQKGYLPAEYVERGFCIDRFPWEGNQALVFESFEAATSKPYKYIFYLTTPDGTILQTVHTERHRDAAQAGFKYLLSQTTGGAHHLYSQLLFPENLDYDELKKAVARIWKNKEKPTATVAVPVNLGTSIK